MDLNRDQALRRLATAERAATDFKADGRPKDVRRIGIVGAGTMGCGIAAAVLSAGFSVVLVSFNEAARLRAHGLLSAIGRPGSFSVEDNLAAAACCDLVIEAVYEDMEAKKALLARLSVLNPEAILASNTSYLNLDEMGAALPRPELLVGLHFFNPAHSKRLIEVVRAAATSPDVLSTALAFGRSLGKICVISAVGEGFIANRIFSAYRRHCEYLVEDGASPQQVDAALVDFGFSMGPFAVADRSGLDIAWSMRRRLASTRDPRERYVTIPDRLCEAGRLGCKTGRGWYRYDDALAEGRPDRIVNEIMEECARDAGRSRRPVSSEEIVDRALGALVNEACLVLSDGIARTAADVDLVMVHAHRFPAEKGGPLYWAWHQSVSKIADMLSKAENAQGFGFRRTSVDMLVSSRSYFAEQ